MFPLSDHSPLPSYAQSLNSSQEPILFSTCYAASRTGDFSKVQSCLTLNPTLISQLDSEGQTLLYACVKGRQLDMMRWLYEKNPLALNIVRSDGQTLMHIAANLGFLEITKWLYEKNPLFLDQVDQHHFTPLHLAAFHQAIPILHLFIEKLKANPSLIQQVAQKNCPKTLAFLLEQGRLAAAFLRSAWLTNQLLNSRLLENR